MSFFTNVMRRVAYFFMGFFILPQLVFAQGEIDEQSRIFYRNEKCIGLVLNTSGYGLTARYGKRLNYFNKQLYEIGLYGYRDNKEVKITNPYWSSNRSFVYGKTNVMFNLNAGYGFQGEWYRKYDVGGIAIRYLFTGGPSLAMYKPIYYQIVEATASGQYQLVTELFSEDLQATDIYARAGFFKGIGEIKFVPGLFAKAGINFEYSRYDETLSAIEVGSIFQAYLKEIPVMANDNNPQFIFSLYASYRFGKIFDPKAREIKRRRKSEQIAVPEETP